MKKLELEFRNKFRKAKTSFKINKMQVILTPPLGEDYWIFRVKLHKNQSIISFPKFGTIGIGFAIEDEDWNTNLPYDCSTLEIYNHIKDNKKYDEITKTDCMKAISIIKKASKYYKENEMTPEIFGDKEEYTNYLTKLSNLILSETN